MGEAGEGDVVVALRSLVLEGVSQELAGWLEPNYDKISS